LRDNQDFKDIEIDKIPKEWEIIRLGNERIADLIMGQSPPSSTYNDKGIGLPFLQGNAEFGDIYPTPILSCSQPTKLSEKNDILLSVRAPVGDVNITPYKICIGRGLAAIRPNKDKLNYLFLFHYLKFASRLFQSISMGSTFKAIRKEEVEKFKLILPPLLEQKKIAEILMTADEAIEKIDEAIEKTERLKKGLMQQLLTKGVGHKEFKETGIGRIPKEWELVKLEDIAEISTGSTPSTINQTYYEGNIPFIKTTEINNNVISETTVFVSKKAVQDYNLKIYPANTIFVAMYGQGKTRGKVSLLDISATTSQNAAAIVLNFKLCHPMFVWYYLLSQYKFLRQTGIHGQISHLNLSFVKKLKLPLPALPEQQKISEILSTVNKKLELLRKKKERFERIKKGLMNDLLTGRKRVNIVKGVIESGGSNAKD
jgi:type I restriction enzyme S subunit